jgi:hypothetical protein
MLDPAETIGSIKRALNLLVVATVVLYVFLGAAVLWTNHEAGVTRDALCALRGDLERRVASSERFLVEHPVGVPGIPASTIREGIINQRRTINALAGLSC